MATSKLKDREVATAIRTVGDGGGLWLTVKKTASGLGRYWAYRYSRSDGKATEMSLGPYPAVSLSRARELRDAAAQLRARGIDPKQHAAEQMAQRMADAQAAASVKTFDQVAAEVIDKRAAGWRSDKHKQQWVNTIQQYVSPIIGSKNVAEVTQADVLRIIEPIWVSRTETARRVLNRISLVLAFAKARGWRTGDNPAIWKGNLDQILPSARSVAQRGHHAAMDYRELPAFVQELRANESVGAKCLLFTILTAARSGETRGARWCEFNLDEARWDVPANRMKGGKAHRAALSKAAVELLRSLPPGEPNALVFCSPYRTNTMLSDATLNATFKRKGIKATAHGTARSSFRTWGAEQTHYERAVLELALAHNISTDVELAYQRSDLFAKRIAVAEDWAAWLARKPAENVIEMPRAQAAA